MCCPILLTDASQTESCKMLQNMTKLGTAVIQMTVIMSHKPTIHTRGRGEGRKIQRKEEIKTERNRLFRIRLTSFENNFLQKTITAADYIIDTKSKVWQDYRQLHAGVKNRKK